MRRSAYKAVDINPIGQSYEHRSKAISVQKTMNLIPQKELTGAGTQTLTSWPGCVAFHTQTTGVNRGITVFNDVLYKVTDNTLSSISSAGLKTDIGTINGTGRVLFANDGTNLIITTGVTAYQYNGTTLSTITDTDITSPKSCTYLNQRIIYDGTGKTFTISDVGDPDSAIATNIGTAESNPDNTRRVYSFREQLYVFCDRTIETWYDRGSGEPVFGRVNNATMQVGLGGDYSVANTDEYVYFLGDDKRFYRFSATQPQNITSIAVSHQLDSMSDISDAIGSVIRVEGQSFYVVTFPTGNKTFVFNEDSGAWFNLSTKATEDRYIGEQFVECYGKRLVSSKDNGSIYEIDLDTYTDNGEVKIQERIFGPILASDLGIGSGNAVMSELWLDMEAGVGTATGQGQNPQLMVSASFDGGQSWTNDDDVLLGRTGDGRIYLKWDHMETFRTMFVRIRLSDPVFFALYGASLSVKPGGI